MNLDDVQRSKVTEWIAQGLKLSEIQNRLASELGLRLTYMEVRLLVDDLKLTPKDVEPSKPASPILPSSTPPVSAGARPPAQPPVPPATTPPPSGPGLGKVSVAVDELARPGAVVSGKVTFSDGNTAVWQLNELGQLGIAPQQPGYRPSAADVEQFQMALETELSKLGL